MKYNVIYTQRYIDTGDDAKVIVVTGSQLYQLFFEICIILS